MDAKTDIEIVPYVPSMRADILKLSLEAWQPVFSRMKAEVLPYVYAAFYPDGWRERQRSDIGDFLDNEGSRTWVAARSGTVLGFVSLRLHPEDKMGEIYILAVDPDHQRKGIGRSLMAFAERHIREAGMDIVMVETGGDSGHRAARAIYEAEGYAQWPVARYFKKL